MADVTRTLGATDLTYDHWCEELDGLKTDQVRRMKGLKTENQRLREAIADITRNKLVLPEAAL